MKQYVIDEIRIEEYEKIRSYLDAYVGSAELSGIYWIPLEEDILNDIQKAHISECGPFYFAVELETSCMTCELLVRTRNRMRCDCIAYANRIQRNWIIEMVDAIFEKLEIKT